MINHLSHISLPWMALVIGLTTAQAFAQAPTDAQRSAIKSSCRSDYMAHCSSVPPGGAASLQCLQKNMTSLSSGCQAAVKAVSPAAEAKPAAAPAAAETSKPTEAKSAATKPEATSGSAAPPTSQTTGSVSQPVAAPATAAASAATPAAAPVLVLRPLRPLEEIRIVKAACGADARAFCSTVEPGGGRIARCLANNAASLSSTCRSMLAQFAAR